MNTKRALATCSAFVAITGGGLLAAASATADPPLPVHVGAHQHWLLTGTGEYVPVGPNTCDDLQGSNAFDNFHRNGHLGVPGNEKLHNIIGRDCGVNPNG
jgi:hypothetical protein